MSRRLMLKSVAQTAPEHTYIAEATYNENCYVDANHVMHLNADSFQNVETPHMAFENVISVESGDTLVLTGSQTLRNYLHVVFYRNNSAVGTFRISNVTAINQTVTSTFSGEIDSLSIRMGGGGSGTTNIVLKITKNGEEWLN